MSNEVGAVSRSSEPLTRSTLMAQFRELGVRDGDILLVHSSLSAMGWVCGGAVAVVQALLDAVGPQGTLVMPTHTPGNTDPANWQNPPVPEAWWDTIRSHMPPFDPETTPSQAMGCIAECFRKWPGALRSAHPVGSFAAWGRYARVLTAEHALEPMFGKTSPIGRIYDADGHVMLLGVGHNSNTSLHLAEYEADFTRRELLEGCARRACPASSTAIAEREWVTFAMLAMETDDFDEIGQAYEKDARPEDFSAGTVGLADARLFRQRPLVDFAVGWMSEHRI